MHKVGGTLLEMLLGLDHGHHGPHIECGQGHQAEFVGYREKYLTTVLAPVHLRRAYYHCANCHRGVVPKDKELDIVDSSLSPGVRRMAARAGSQESFAQASRDLADLAAISLPAKQVERVAEANGDRVKARVEQEWEAIISGAIAPLPTGGSIPKLYVTIDGTGVPTVPKENEGRRGKGADGRAHTREVKVGCLFTQTGLDEHGRPVRDPASSSYLAVVESSQRFGQLLYAEAARRGVGRADTAIVIGDGARWIWNLADEHFPRAVQIVDLYHAREHLHSPAKLVFTDDRQRWSWVSRRIAELDRGEVEAVLAKLSALNCAGPAAQAVQEATSYFDNNRERMRYARFRSLGLFVGSGAVEAGCKTIVHQRLKQSGMRWTVRGAESIMSLRCCEASGRWEEFWKPNYTQTAIA
ncbi:MAG: ISKra4 family transposase [Candidatus Dormibacteraceae bacterium]